MECHYLKFIPSQTKISSGMVAVGKGINPDTATFWRLNISSHIVKHESLLLMAKASSPRPAR